MPSNYNTLMGNILTFPGLPTEEIAEFSGALRVLTMSLASMALVIFVLINGILDFRPVVLFQGPLALLLIALHARPFHVDARQLLTFDGILFVVWGGVSHAMAPMGFSIGYYVALAGISSLYVALGARPTLMILAGYMIMATAIGITLRDVVGMRLAVNAVSFVMLALWLMSLMYGLATGLQRRDKAIELQRELAETGRRQARMFSIIAHELRTPAAAARMLADQPDLASSRRELQSVTQHLLSVIDDMRVAVNPDSDFELNEGPFDPLDLLNDIERQVTPLLSDGAFTLNITSDLKDTNILSGDAYRLRAVATNLLRNAYHHSSGNEIWLRIGAESADETHTHLWLEIEDNGRGIPADELPTLMEPFERGQTNAAGVGLGLHIVNAWTQRMGGELAYFHGATGGAGFRLSVTLPVCQSGAPDQPEQLTLARAILAGRRILLAEDDWLNAKLIANLLHREFDIDLRMTRDGAEALEELTQNGPFDLVITDYHMPKMTGLELTTTLRSQGYTGPILGLTAATLGAEVAELLAHGADEVLSKPMELAMFSRWVTTLRERGKLA